MIFLILMLFSIEKSPAFHVHHVHVLGYPKRVSFYNKTKHFLFTPFLIIFLQNTFDAGLNAFETEGISRVTTLKEELVKANHEQSEAITARHDGLLARYEFSLCKQKTLPTLPYLTSVGYQPVPIRQIHASDHGLSSLFSVLLLFATLCLLEVCL